MAFHFGQLIAHAAKTRNLRAGAIIGTGAVSNRTRSAVNSSIAGKRALETIAHGAPQTAFMKYGDNRENRDVRRSGKSIFGAIEQGRRSAGPGALNETKGFRPMPLRGYAARLAGATHRARPSTRDMIRRSTRYARVRTGFHPFPVRETYMTDSSGATPPFPGFPGFPPAEVLDRMWDMMRLTPFGTFSGAPQGMAPSLSMMSDMMAPLTSVEELDKRITDMRAVEQWLKLNLNMLQSAPRRWKCSVRRWPRCGRSARLHNRRWSGRRKRLPRRSRPGRQLFHVAPGGGPLKQHRGTPRRKSLTRPNPPHRARRLASTPPRGGTCSSRSSINWPRLL